MERRGVYMRIRRQLSFVRTYIPSIYPQSIHLFAGHSYGRVGWLDNDFVCQNETTLFLDFYVCFKPSIISPNMLYRHEIGLKPKQQT